MGFWIVEQTSPVCMFWLVVVDIAAARSWTDFPTLCNQPKELCWPRALDKKGAKSQNIIALVKYSFP